MASKQNDSANDGDDSKNKKPGSNTSSDASNSGRSQSSAASNASSSGRSQSSAAPNASSSGRSQSPAASNASSSGRSQSPAASNDLSSGSSQSSAASNGSSSDSTQQVANSNATSSDSLHSAATIPNHLLTGSLAVAVATSRHQHNSNSNVLGRKRSRSVGSLCIGSARSGDGVSGSKTPVKKQTPAKRDQKPNVSNKTSIVKEKVKDPTLAASSCASFLKDVEFRGERFGSSVDSFASNDEYVSVLELNQQRARFVFKTGQEAEATVADFNRVFQRLRAAPDLVIRLQNRVYFFNVIQYWNNFVRNVSSLTIEGDAYDSDVHFILDRSYHLRYLQLSRITMAGRNAGVQPTSLFGDLAYHLPNNLASLTVDCRGFGNGGFLHVLKHTAARMYQCDRHQLDHATFVVHDFPRLRALDQYVSDFHFWIYSSLTILVARPPDDNFVQILNQRQFYILGRIHFNEIDDTFVIYRCHIGQLYLQIGFIFPQ